MVIVTVSAKFYPGICSVKFRDYHAISIPEFFRENSGVRLKGILPRPNNYWTFKLVPGTSLRCNLSPILRVGLDFVEGLRFDRFVIDRKRARDEDTKVL